MVKFIGRGKKNKCLISAHVSVCVGVLVCLCVCVTPGGCHPEQPCRAVWQEGQIQGGRATLQESPGDP